MWATSGMDSEQEELCLIDSRIKSLRQVPLRAQLQVINLHCNQLTHIEGLDYLQQLRHLDLSSNQISHISGLEYLVALRTLNLACNLIEAVEGLQNLRSLVKLNLSYNQVTSLAGFQALRGTGYQLKEVELQGNRIQGVDHVTRCLQGCANLRRLELCRGGASNPVCQTPDYRGRVMQGLPMLHSLDGADRQGRPVISEEPVATLPGLEKYMEYLTSNNASMSSEANVVDLATPAIDAALQKFRHRGGASELSTSATLTSDQDMSHAERNASVTSQNKAFDQSRLEKLENQLAELLMSKGATSNTAKLDGVKTRAKRDVDDTDESEGECGRRKPRHNRKSRLPSYQKHTAASRSRAAQMSSSATEEPSSSTVKPDHNPVRMSGQATTHMTSSELSSSARHVPVVTGNASDTRHRDDLKNTYVSLMGELERERERRWKAEGATKKLIEHIRQLQTKDVEGRQTQDLTQQVSERLKTALMHEREAKLKLQAEIELLNEKIAEQSEKLLRTEKLCEQSNAAVRDLQDTSSRREAEMLQQQAHEGKKLQEVTMRASAGHRELEIVRGQVKTLKGQLAQMQELLANREQEHREDLKGRHAVESPEFRDMLARETGKLEKLHAQELQLQQQRVDTVTEKYAELEDEFRLALHLESKRFTELQEAYKSLSDEAAHDRKLLDTLQRKEENSSDMLNELTQLVKEQKGRITELSKAKQEQSSEYRERVGALETHLEEARKRMVQLEMLKQEKVKMSSQVQAQESVIQGLKAERRLWGEELAQQGAALGQDRGRMEAKIEQLTSEVTQVKRQLDKEADGLKIKTKIIEDQTESIRKLKDGVLERDEEIRRLRETNVKQAKEHEEALSAEVNATSELQNKLERARDRKDELKQQVAELEDKLMDTERAHGELSSQWKKKSNVISELERQVTNMKNGWLSKEQKLTQDRDKAMEAARIAVDKIKSMDDAFRTQLDSKQLNHAEALRKVEQEAQDQVNAANKRVLEVEQEMRDLLSENESAKRDMEDKVKKLTRAMGELQQGLF